MLDMDSEEAARMVASALRSATERRANRYNRITGGIAVSVACVAALAALLASPVRFGTTGELNSSLPVAIGFVTFLLVAPVLFWLVRLIYKNRAGKPPADPSVRQMIDYLGVAIDEP
jgi:hypothetical protein